MRQGGTAQQGCSPVYFWRTHFCKIVLVILFLFLFLQYATNVLVYKHGINKMVSPGLAWISQSLQQKLGIGEERMVPVVLSTDYVRTNVTNATHIVNTTSVQSVSNSTASKNLMVGSVESTDHANTSQEIPLCPLVPPKLVGRLKLLTESPSFEELEKMFSSLEPGGRYKPSDCISRHKVALIIPYRDREEHLRIFLHNMHPILQRQQLDYGIYVIEETADTKFNRAMLMNIGFTEALKQYDYDCFIFHDVDLIPEDDRNLYTCPEQPRHMSVAINTMNYRLPYKDIFGGVSALTKKHMLTVNGFSNEFWGWGGEDDDMSNRIRHHGLKISRYSPKIARYTMLKHKKDEPNPERYNKLYKGKYRYKKDGLSNLKYNLLDLVLKKLYTWVLVEIEPIK